ncbi:hypothetical protein P3T76_013073 [Phytophthora citrophthora]|uniref:Uncharacterized protein n=1 Tax=Phytophthora citrophthora TaxID=4793 RepID=A0AAD9G4I0_9STRA|nr:hypothetical protein P3T76_013073 [Phytophthora citrophthora]
MSAWQIRIHSTHAAHRPALMVDPAVEYCASRSVSTCTLLCPGCIESDRSTDNVDPTRYSTRTAAVMSRVGACSPVLCPGAATQPGFCPVRRRRVDPILADRQALRRSLAWRHAKARLLGSALAAVRLRRSNEKEARVAGCIAVEMRTAAGKARSMAEASCFHFISTAERGCKRGHCGFYPCTARCARQGKQGIDSDITSTESRSRVICGEKTTGCRPSKIKLASPR